MRELKFHYAAAKNFICFGPDGIELFFNDYGKLVLVNGLNYDDGTPTDPASNGAGKSSLQDILSYALYGKTVKKPKQLYHGDVVNTLAGKGLEVEVQFDDYRVRRCRLPNKLQVWHSKDHLWDDTTEVTRGTMAETQKLIDEVVGLSHRAFCNVMAFDDSDAHSFLEADTKEKREIVENLLGLDKYRDYLEIAKEMRKTAKTVVDDLTKDYEHLAVEHESCKKRVVLISGQEESWKQNVKNWLATAVKKVKDKQEELETTDDGQAMSKFQQAQDQIGELQDKVIEFNHKRDRLGEIINEANEKLTQVQAARWELNESLQKHQLAANKAQSMYEESQKHIDALSSLQEGQECPTCRGIISRDHYSHVLAHEQNVLEQSFDTLQRETSIVEVEKQKFGDRSAAITKLESHIMEAKKSLSVLESKLNSFHQELLVLGKIKKPEGNSAQQLLEAEITELKRQCREKKAELDNGSPYKEILEEATTERDKKKQEMGVKDLEIKEAESVIPYYSFWVDAFGDKGIRRFIVNGIIPALNTRIAYWMQHLIDNKIELTFNDKLEETILRNGNNALYHSMSKGEKRRINLAVSQAFSYVMTLHSGCCPSLVFLDEVTGGGIDRVGVTGVYNMVFELAKERQVFITTHNETLLEMLEGCENITLKKQNDITVLVS